VTATRRPVVTLGETMALFRTTTPGPIAHAATVEIGIGGSESNVAIGLCRLGVTAVWFGVVGEDSLGTLVAREIRAEGVDLRVSLRPEPTGLMVKERRTAQRQSVTYYRAGSAGSRLSPEHLDAATIARASLLHITGITPALSSSARDAVEYAVDVARDNGVPVSFDLNYRSRLWSIEEAGSFYRRIIPRCTIIFAGDDEAAIAVGPQGSPRSLAAALAALGPSEVVIKLGAEGALSFIDGETLRRPALQITPVDTVGAGDAFVAGYLSEVVAGATTTERLNTAVTTAAHVCLVLGDWEGLPRRAELDVLDSEDPVAR